MQQLNQVITRLKKDLMLKNHLHVLKVAEKIQEELEDYRSREDDIKRMKHEMGMEGQDEAAGLLSDNTQV